MKSLARSFSELLKYPSAIIGLISILALIGVAIYALISIPYADAVYQWRGGEEVWYQNPRQAAPAWFNFFSAKKQPVSFTLRSNDEQSEQVTQVVETDLQGGSEIILTYTFDYTYDDFPQEIALYFKSKYETKQPYASVVWIKPDGKEIRVANLGLSPQLTFQNSHARSVC
jgi:peptide/nickel transport system permease protein